jgi:hypothetical protein
MTNSSLSIAEGGEFRLRKAIEAEVRRKYEQELSAATDHWSKAAIEQTIQLEIEAEMKRVASPQSLWSFH